MKTIYKHKTAKDEILSLYDEKLASLHISYENIDIQTSFGRTRIIKTGNENGKKIVLFHGINAGAPLTLEAVKNLHKNYLIFAIDTIGQATKSDETIINIKDNSYALWAEEVLKGLNIKESNFIGISYGSFILQKLISYRPKHVSTCIFVVPSGLVNGEIIPSFTKLTIPLLKFMITKKDKHLKAFIEPFVPKDDLFMFKLQKAIMLGVNIDFRRPVLLKKESVNNYKNPVYMIVADNDIFFPADKAVTRAKNIFKNLKDVHYLKNCKHMPEHKDFNEIQQKINEWLSS